MYKLTDLPTRPATRLSAALGVFFLLLVGSVHVSAQPGAPDFSFNSSGYVTTSVAGGGSQSTAVAAQADGKTVVAGYVNLATGGQDFALVRYNVDGTLDTSFDGDGQVTTSFGGSSIPEQANAVAIQSDGKIIAAGFTGAFGPPEFALARYNSDGSLDTTFDSDGKVIPNIGTSSGIGNDIAYAITIQDDGKIVVAGYASVSTGSLWDLAVARFNVDGSLDVTFDGDGKALIDISSTANDIAYSVAIQADGKIIAGGVAGSAGGASDFAVVRLNPNGTLDTSFDTDGKVTTAIGPSTNHDEARALAIHPDGKIIAVGYTYMGGTTGYDFALARYNVDGSLDTTFDSDGITTTPVSSASGTDAAFAGAVQTDGKILAGGYVSNATVDIALARYNSDGSLDTAFSGDGVATIDLGGTEYMTAMALYGANRVVIAGAGTNNFLTARMWLTTLVTAAPVTVTGRVTDVYGRGLQGARVTLSDAAGAKRYATTNMFGYYRFSEVPSGEGYLLNVSAKGYTFGDPVRYVQLNEDLAGADFIAQRTATVVKPTQQAKTPVVEQAAPTVKPAAVKPSAPAALRKVKGKMLIVD